MDAAVSGPGKMSRRTDRGPAQKIRELPDAQYGEAATYRDLQQSAPLSQTPASAAPAPQGGGSPGGGPDLVPFNAPSTRPDEPVTAGADAGPGPDSSALGIPNPQQQTYASARNVLQTVAESGSTEASALLNMLDQRL